MGGPKIEIVQQELVRKTTHEAVSRYANLFEILTTPSEIIIKFSQYVGNTKTKEGKQIGIAEERVSVTLSKETFVLLHKMISGVVEQEPSLREQSSQVDIRVGKQEFESAS